MKKITVITLIVLAAAVLSAAVPAPRPVPPPVQSISGTLKYSRTNICMIPDFIALPVMKNVYLTGYKFPTLGQYQGCQISATGWYVSVGTCSVFQVSSSSILCLHSRPTPSPSPSPDTH